MNFKLFLLLIFLIDFTKSNLDEQIGRIENVDRIISDPDVLKAVAFSVKSKDMIYKKVLKETIQNIKSLKNSIREEHSKLFKYYVYILKNVHKYTVKWLTEEIIQLNSKVYENSNDIFTISKRNIANFIYHTASEYAIDLVLQGRDTSLNDWLERHNSKINKQKEDL